jgi:4-hydroxybenzoyl-CoA thioesterase
VVVVEHAVRFEEVDAAGLVFFAHLGAWAHEAMVRFFDQLDGGYVRLITERRIGLPAVKLEAEFHAPLRYGDVVAIETSVAKVGNKSAVFVYRMKRQDGELAAELRHTVVTTDLEAVRSCPMPADVRAALEAHRSTGHG